MATRVVLRFKLVVVSAGYMRDGFQLGIQYGSSRTTQNLGVNSELSCFKQALQFLYSRIGPNGYNVNWTVLTFPFMMSILPVERRIQP